MMEQVKETFLTTVDNPFDPITQYEDWLTYDTTNGYNSNQLLARMLDRYVKDSENASLYDIEYVIDRIIAVDPLKIYKKLTKTS